VAEPNGGLSTGQKSFARRDDIRQNFDSIAAALKLTAKNINDFTGERSNAGRSLRGHIPVLSGGICGKPLPFLHQKNAAKRFLNGLLSLFNDDDMAAFAKGGGTWAVLAPAGRFDFPSQMLRARFSLPWNQKKMNIVSLNRPMGKVVSHLNELSPAAIIAYPSVLLRLAKESEEKRLNFSPAFIISWGELLSPREWQYISRAFGCPLRDVYISAEGAFAAKCDHGSFHALGGCDLAPSADGRLLLSADINKALYLSDYATGDMAKAAADCGCGNKDGFILYGKEDDFIRIFGKTIAPQALSDVMDRLEPEGAKKVERYQITQADDHTLAVALSCPEGERVLLFKKAMAALDGLLEGMGIEGVRIALSGQPPAPHKRSGKFRKVIGR
jgi:phenylacetate-CoA ligase